MFKRRKPSTGKAGDNPLASRVVRGDDRPTEPLPGETPTLAPEEAGTRRVPDPTRKALSAVPDHEGRESEPATRLVSRPDAQDDATEDGGDLPVGVLLVVRGPGRGALLPVRPGANDLGRGVTARIRLNFGDPGIAHERHAVLTHDSARRCFTLQPGDSADPVTLDGKAVLEPVELEDGALLQLGDTEFLFHPLPGSHDIDSESG